MGKLSKPLLKQYIENVDKLSPGELVLLREEVDEQLKPLKDLSEIIKERFTKLLGEMTEMQVNVPSIENAKVTYPFRIYKQFSKRWEKLPMSAAEKIVGDLDNLDLICEPRVVNFDKAEEVLPDEIVAELKAARTPLKPSFQIKVGMAKRG